MTTANPPEDLRAATLLTILRYGNDQAEGLRPDPEAVTDDLLRLCEAAVLAALPEKYQDATHLDYAINDVIDQAKDNIHSVFGGTGK